MKLEAALMRMMAGTITSAGVWDELMALGIGAAVAAAMITMVARLVVIAMPVTRVARAVAVAVGVAALGVAVRKLHACEQQVRRNRREDHQVSSVTCH